MRRGRIDYIIKGIAMAVVTLLLLTSCHQKELTGPMAGSGLLNVKYQWERGETAEGMTLYFYPTDGVNRIWRYDIAGREGGIVELPYGYYQLVTFNNDAPTIRLSMTENAAELRGELKQMGGISQPSGRIFRANADDIEFRYGSVKYDCGAGIITDRSDTLTMICRPKRITTLYKIKVLNVEGLERVRYAEGILWGIASQLLLQSGEPAGESINGALTFEMMPERMEMQADFETFPLDPKATQKELEIRAALKSGKMISTKIDVNNLIVNNENDRSVTITITGLKIPEGGDSPTGGDVEMEVGVDGWNEITIDYDTSKM